MAKPKSKPQAIADKVAVVRPFDDGSFYFHAGSTRRVKYGRELEAAMDSLARSAGVSRSPGR